MKWKIKLRAIVSSLLLLAFIIMFFTGLGLYLSPSGRIAREIGWTFLGFEKLQLENLHTIMGFVMSGLIALHLVTNWKMFMNELKILFKK